MQQLLKRLTLPALLAFSMTACGGGSDDPIPSGDDLPDVQFMDSDSYHPLDKLDASGAVLAENASNYGTRNPLRRGRDGTMSVWAIDTSAEAPDGEPLEYSMKIEAVRADSKAYNSLLANLKIDAKTGMIYQQCSGYPVCYDNETSDNQDFRITAIARIAGSKRALERPFIFRVVAN